MYDDYGKDIVCASVSTTVITSINAILSFDNKAIFYKTDEGYINIDILKHDNITDTLITNMVNMLEELGEKYKKNIQINREV